MEITTWQKQQLTHDKISMRISAKYFNSKIKNTKKGTKKKDTT